MALELKYASDATVLLDDLLSRRTGRCFSRVTRSRPADLQDERVYDLNPLCLAQVSNTKSYVHTWRCAVGEGERPGLFRGHAPPGAPPQDLQPRLAPEPIRSIGAHHMPSSVKNIRIRRYP